jgi:hypothetical protein
MVPAKVFEISKRSYAGVVVILVVNGSGSLIPATVKYSNEPSMMPMSGATGL